MIRDLISIENDLTALDAAETAEGVGGIVGGILGAPAPLETTAGNRPRRAPRAASSPAAVRRVGKLIEENRNYAYATARRVFSAREDAEDAVSEASARAILFADTYDSKQPFERWFAHIVTMICFEWLRAKNAQKRPQTMCFTSAAQRLAHDAGEAGGADWYFDIADTRVNVENEAIGNVLGVADLPPFLIDGLLKLSMLHRSLLMDLYVMDVPRAKICEERGWNEYQLTQNLLDATRRLYWAVMHGGGVPAGVLGNIKTGTITN